MPYVYSVPQAGPVFKFTQAYPSTPVLFYAVCPTGSSLIFTLFVPIFI